MSRDDDYDYEEDFDLDVVPERPPSLDEKGHRLFIIPASVKGRFRDARNYFYFFLLGIFLIVPWTRYAGEQTIHLDISNRKFIFFGNVFFAHDTPMLFFITAIGAFSIILATAIYGRIWCGWACPQTVFIDAVFRKIEEWIEGNHLKRRKLMKAPWNKEKILKTTLKWGLFAIVSSHIAHSFTAYFVGARELIDITLHSPALNWGLFVFVQVFTLITLINFGWFREQFCLIVCPYGRFQSVLMDQHSLAVLYDHHRGEPRKQKGVADGGDCVNCYRCSIVCPTGIDIRNGMQMECITCTACIDACDEVMDKVGKPRGLIRYASSAEMNHKKRKVWTTRNSVYVGIITLLFMGLSYSLAHRPLLDVKIVRAIEAPYSVIESEKGTLVLNHFRIHATNQADNEISLKSFSLSSDKIEIISPTLQKTLKPRESQWIHFFAKFPKDMLNDRGVNKQKWALEFTGKEKGLISGEIKLLGP